METYGQMIARLRDERGWTQQKLADLAGIPKRTLQEIEGGNVANPQRRNKMKLAAALEIEGDPDETRNAFPRDVRVFLDVMGAFLSGLPDRAKLDVIEEINATYIIPAFGNHNGNGHPNSP